MIAAYARAIKKLKTTQSARRAVLSFAIDIAKQSPSRLHCMSARTWRNPKSKICNPKFKIPQGAL